MRQTSLESQNSDTPQISIFRQGLPQFLAIGVKNVLLLGYGMSLGFPTILIPAIQGGDGRDASTHGEFLLSREEISWLSSINLFCVPLGCIFSGSFTQPFGLRRAMQLVNIPILISWLLFHFSTNTIYLYVGLSLMGISGGLMEAPVLTYVAEITEPRFRGMLAATGTTFILIGVSSQFIMGTFLKWRTVAIFSAIVPIISTILLFFVPESPYWLVRHNHHDRAKKSLAWLRGWVSIKSIEHEYDEINASVIQHHSKIIECSETTKLFMKRNFIYPFLLISLTFFVGSFSGMTTLQTYAVQIFHTLKAPIDKYYATSLLGCIQLIGSILCVLLVHLTGKRPLVFMSLIGLWVCFLGTAMYTYFLDVIPGVAVSNVVSNVSSLNLNNYYNIIPLNRTNMESFIHSEEQLVQTTTELTNYLVMENVTAANDSTNFTNILNETDYDLLNFDNLDINYFTVADNDTYTEIDNDDQTAGRSSAETVISVIPKNFLLPLPDVEENKFLWIPLTLLLTSALVSHAGIRIIPWMLIGELFPPSVRGVSAGLASGVGYFFQFLANKLFLSMVSEFTLPGTFVIYSCISFIGIIIFYFTLPETEGKKLREIESHFVSGGQKLNTNKKQSKLLNHHDRIHKRAYENKKGRKISPLPNFDVSNWESNLKFQKHLEETQSNLIRINDESKLNGHKPMGLKKNKKIHRGNVNSSYVENETTNL